MRVRCWLRGAKLPWVDLAGVSVTGQVQELDLDEGEVAAMRERAAVKAQRYTKAKGWHLVALDARAMPGDVLLTDLLVLEPVDAAPVAWSQPGATWAGDA